MRTHQFNAIFLITTLAISSQSALANPNSYTHLNGSTVVDINKADANGLSHNMWSEFNVGKKGMVLNNSTENLVRDSGNIAKNNNLDTAAKVILNEVISNKASTLSGFIEVAGQKADVIIANPNGITCSGCSFINTSRSTLTTGTPVMVDGALTGFNIIQGRVTIDKNGLKNEQSYTDILAETVRINGLVETDSLKAVAGKYSWDSASSTATSDGGHTLFTTAIDVSALGGVTAGVIQLQTTKAGIGVNNNGTLSADSIQIASNGSLTNTGVIKASSSALLSTAASMNNSGSIAGKNVQLSSSTTLSNSGTVKADSVLYTLAAGKISNSAKGTLSGTAANQIVSYAGDIENKGVIESEGAVYARTGYMPNESYVLTPVANTRIINTGSISGATGVTLQATKAINLTAGSLDSQATAYLGAATVNNVGTLNGNNITVYSNTFENSGTLQAANQLTVTGVNSISNYGTLKGKTLTLNTEGEINGASCSWLVLCKKGTLSAETLTLNAPTVSKISDLGGNIIAQVIELNKPASATGL